MRIKIAEHAIRRWSRERYHVCNPQYREHLREEQGNWIDVETKFLFNDQYNTDRLRIMDADVEAIEDDVRLGKMSCKWCGVASDLAPTCPNCGNHHSEGYLVKFNRHHLDKQEQESVFNHQHVRTFLDGTWFTFYAIILETLPNWILLEVKMQYEKASNAEFLGEFEYVVIRQGDYMLTKNSNFEEPVLTFTQGVHFTQYDDAIKHFRTYRKNASVTF